jgi:hypothetical protein
MLLLYVLTPSIETYMTINGKTILKTSLIGIMLSTGLTPGAFAQLTYKSNTVYRAGLNEIIVSGTPSTKVSVNEGTYTKSVNKTANACGQVKITKPKLGFSNLKVNGVAIDITTLTTVTSAPKCTAGVLKTPQPTAIQTETGTVVVPGLTANASIPVSYDTPKVKNLSINSCGFAAIKTSTSSPTLPTTLLIGGTTYTTATLPDSSEPPRLQRVNGVSTCYTPTGWTN